MWERGKAGNIIRKEDGNEAKKKRPKIWKQGKAAN